ncbi:hypothetical protein [Marinifilum sp. D737]|uniref:hypothetical protein n=1 Tax=Marinifilum sp. D737 TaxID=2969628 RepID=UPI0022724A0A|nr:hypothetical protein [Marinifilum sp. D737]MCY1636253.1 hypothetical protein [Marinifilum sp. D737]
MATNDTLKSKRDEANKIVEEIKASFQIIEANLNESKSILKQHEDNSTETKKINTTLKRLAHSTEVAIAKFRSERDKVSRLLTQVNNFYEKKYVPLLNKVEDENTGFRARLKQGTQFKNEILKIKESSKTQYDEVKKFASELRKSNRELTVIDSSIRKLFQNSTNKNSKINEINAHVSELDKKILKTHDNLNKLFIQSQKNEKVISELLIKSNTEFENIRTIKSDSEKLLSDIQEIYEIAAETGLSGEFDKRRKHLKESLVHWEKRIFITTVVLLVVIIIMFVGQLWLYKWDIENHTFDINFYVRFLIASPIVYYLYFCSSQYSQTKKLHDKYSFKTTLAMSIKHHIQLLTEHEKFNKDERINKILDFVLDGFQRIYTEPHTNDDYKLKLKLANMEMDIEKRLIESISKFSGIKTDNK